MRLARHARRGSSQRRHPLRELVPNVVRPLVRRSWAAGLFTLLMAVLSAQPTQAQVVQQTNVQAPQDDGPSIFDSGYQGLLAGAAAGAGGGYIAGRRDGWKKSDWRAVGLGIGIGALAGAGLGLSLGFADKAGAPGGRFVARDLAAGAGFGALIGAISGGISAAINNKAEYVLFGAAIGVISGAGLGIITGIVEGQAKKHRQAATATTTTSSLRLQPTLAWLKDAHGSTALMPGFSGSF
jgi:MFS family permease